MTDNGEKDFEKLKGKRLTSFLNLGFLAESRPVDELLKRLDEPDGVAWLERLMASSVVDGHGPTGELLAEESTSLDDLESMKDASKRLLKRAGTPDERLQAMVIYFLSIAAAVAHHGTAMTDRSRDELDPIYLDLAAALPEPWAGLAARAIQKPAAEDS